MPYSNRSELPDNVANVLPPRAQDIYQGAFNSAWDRYKDPDNRKSGTREETAHAAAWSAVKQKYEKGDNGNWQPKP